MLYEGRIMEYYCPDCRYVYAPFIQEGDWMKTVKSDVRFKQKLQTLLDDFLCSHHYCLYEYLTDQVFPNREIIIKCKKCNQEKVTEWK